MRHSIRVRLLRAALAAALVSTAVLVVTTALVVTTGCGSWRNAIKHHTPMPEAAGGVPARLVKADQVVEEAVRAADAYAQFPTTLYDERRTPQLFKEVLVLYGASLDTFPQVLDASLRTRDGRVLSSSKRGRRTGEESWLLVKVKLRVPEKVICWLEVRRRPPSSARLAIIIDDVGSTTRGLDTAAALPPGITFSVLPHLRHARECAEALHESGHTIMLHQPMEPIPRDNGDELDPGPGAVRVGMAADEIRATVAGNLEAVPHVAAVNNHMGSKATADEATVRAVLLELRERAVPFVDSLTISTSVCRRVAGELGVPCAVRNAAFLDNSRARRAIRERLQAACQVARTEGLAITIGHFHPAMLDVLAEFDFGEVELVPVTHLFETVAPEHSHGTTGRMPDAEEGQDR